MKVVYLIAFIFLSTVSANVIIECEYKNDTVVTLNNYDPTLICYANVKSGLSESKGSQIEIIPIDDIQRHQVQYFRLADQDDISNHFDSIMKSIANNFPKLRGIRLGNVSISNVSKDHLKIFPNLELLSLDNNNIRVLETDLFAYTPKLKFIYFDHNLISNVDDNLLSSLDFIEVDFSSNPCIDKSTCESQLLYKKLKDKNPTLYHYYDLYEAMKAVLKEDPNYGR